MEQQTISISKAGIVTVLKCNTSILASCNPVDSRWNHKKSIVENVNIEGPLLSRFDIVSIVIDRPEEENDRRVANHLVNLFSINMTGGGNSVEKETELLKEAIQIAKTFTPKIDEEG